MRRLEDGRWKMEDGEFLVASFYFLVSKSWGKVVYNVWRGVGRNRSLYTAAGSDRSVPLGINGGLHTFFTRLSTAVSHKYFEIFPSVSTVVTPTFHRTYKDNYKVYKLLITSLAHLGRKAPSPCSTVLFSTLALRCSLFIPTCTQTSNKSLI
jgi:hypothetical protein